MCGMSQFKHTIVTWEEHIICGLRGSRVVHYHVKNESGESVLAAIGHERSIRHMVYVVSNEFLQTYGSNRFINASTKWRARRDVVNWLTSMVSRHQPVLPVSGTQINSSEQDSRPFYISVARDSTCHFHLPDHLFQRRLKVHKENIEWSGVAWICTKQLKHYAAFWRTGTTITVHSFVSILAEEESHYLGYLEDMYEDKKGQKKVKVRWLCHNQEVNGIIPQLNPHPREVFLTSHVQVISAESVHRLATVLTPWHYEKCVAILPHSSLSSVHMCCRQFKENKVKPFSLTKLYGYPNQTILSSLDSASNPMHMVNCHNPNKENMKELTCDDPVRVRTKRCKMSDGHQGLESHSASRNLVSGNQIAKYEPAYPKLKLHLSPKTMGHESVAPQTQCPAPFKANEKIELLCQDSGLRGCWFMCQILQASNKRLKVQYDNVQDADGSGNLEEWVPVSRVAAPCKLDMRCSGRQTIRPHPPKESAYCNFDVGVPVDAWWSDGWWEGIVSGVGLSGDSCLQVYLPGEDKCLIIQQTNVRTSRDWVDNRWVNIKPKPDILCYLSTRCISAALAEDKFIQTMKLKAIVEDKPMVSSENDVMRNVLHADYEDKKAISVGSKNDGDGCDDNKKEVGVAATDNDVINEDNARDPESLSQKSEIAKDSQVVEQVVDRTTKGKF